VRQKGRHELPDFFIFTTPTPASLPFSESGCLSVLTIFGLPAPVPAHRIAYTARSSSSPNAPKLALSVESVKKKN
jgi:hypothetical protein